MKKKKKKHFMIFSFIVATTMSSFLWRGGGLCQERRLRCHSDSWCKNGGWFLGWCGVWAKEAAAPVAFRVNVQ